MPKSFFTADQLRQRLHEALAELPLDGECALLDWPDYLNPGDHLIWAAAWLYLTGVRRARVCFDASACGGPLVFSGGGNFGDLWPRHQIFREELIARFPGRPVVVLPQTIHFQAAEALERAARIFNAHPDVTLFVRDRHSLDLAGRHFTRCRVRLAPDMGFHFAGRLRLIPPLARRPQLKLLRNDPESTGAQKGGEDWVTLRRAWLGLSRLAATPLPAVRLRLRQAREWCAAPAARWLEHRSLAAFLAGFPPEPRLRESLALVHAAAYQLLGADHIVTDRLHGYIFASLLGLPCELRDNAYGKNEWFRQTWPLLP